MNVETSGADGRPVVLVHGFGASGRFWRNWTPALAERARVFNIDLVRPAPPGATRDHAPPAQASRLATFIRSIESDLPPVLVGHSLGAGITLAATLELLDDGEAMTPAALVLVSGALFPQRLPTYMSLARRRGIGELFLLATPPRSAIRFGLRGLVADPETVDDAQVDAYLEPLRERAQRRALLETARKVSLDDARPVVSRLGQLSMPALLIWGSEDRVVPPEAGHRLAAAIPDAEMVMIDGVGHLPPEEAPDRSLTPVLRLLDSIG